MFIGDKKNPIAIGKKSELLANLDEEFYLLLREATNHFTGFKKISSDDKELPYAYIEATRYLVLELMRYYGNNGGF